jgi:hypothetical protein
MSGSICGVIPGRVSRDEIDVFVNFERTRESGIRNPCREYGFRACATRRRLAPTWTAHPGMTSSESFPSDKHSSGIT